MADGGDDDEGDEPRSDHASPRLVWLNPGNGITVLGSLGTAVARRNSLPARLHLQGETSRPMRL